MKGRRLAIFGLVLGYANAIVVAAFSIPVLLHHRILTNEEAAIGHLRTIERAQDDYSFIHRTTTRENSGGKCYIIRYLYPYAPDFATLTKMQEEEAPPFRRWNWSNENLPKEGVPKDGYVFKIKLTNDSYHYEITASPAKPGHTGSRYFFSNTGGTIRANVGAPADSTSPRIEEPY